MGLSDVLADAALELLCGVEEYDPPGHTIYDDAFINWARAAAKLLCVVAGHVQDNRPEMLPNLPNAGEVSSFVGPQVNCEEYPVKCAAFIPSDSRNPDRFAAIA